MTYFHTPFHKLHHHLEVGTPSNFFPNILIQTAQVPELLDSAKILPKISTFWVGGNNVTDDRQTDGSCSIGPNKTAARPCLSWHSLERR